MAIFIKANRAIISPLAGNPLAPLPAFTSDAFSGGDVDGLAGRMSDALIAGEPKPWIAVDNSLAISGGKLVRGSLTTAVWFNGFDMTGSADYAAEIKVLAATTGAIFLDVRRESFAVTPGPNAYRAQIKNTGVTLYKRISGTSSAISSEFPILPGDIVKLSAKGSAITLYINDVEKASVINTEITAAGYCGIAGSSGVNPFQLDDFMVTTL